MTREDISVWVIYGDKAGQRNAALGVAERINPKCPRIRIRDIETELLTSSEPETDSNIHVPYAPVRKGLGLNIETPFENTEQQKEIAERARKAVKTYLHKEFGESIPYPRPCTYIIHTRQPKQVLPTYSQ